jgi:hypothetical protein
MRNFGPECRQQLAAFMFENENIFSDMQFAKGF